MNELKHYGIKNQKWGVRRFQNEDGTWTEEGKIRYGSNSERRAELKDVKESYKKAKYASAVTNDYQYKINDAKRRGNTDKANALYERGKKAAKSEEAITREAVRKYDAFCKKYGQTKIKNIDWVTDDGGTRVTMKGKNEVNKILNSSTLKGVVLGQVAIGPIGAGVGGYIGYTKDRDRRNAYESELDKIK